MMNSHAAKASPRCALATPTSTMRSPGTSAPTRWITSVSRMSQRAAASAQIVLERLLGHARVVLERHAETPLAVVGVAHQAHEARERADVGAPARERLELAPDVEVGFLDAHDRPRSAAGHRREERHLVAGLERRGDVGHLLVHRHAQVLAGREGLGPAARRASAGGRRATRPWRCPRAARPARASRRAFRAAGRNRAA